MRPDLYDMHRPGPCLIVISIINFLGTPNSDILINIPVQAEHRLLHTYHDVMTIIASTHVLLVGATSCLGYEFLHLFVNHKSDITVDLVEDVEHLGVSSVGYSWAEVNNKFSLQPKWLEMSDVQVMGKYIKETRPKTILYTPFNTLYSDPSTTLKYRDKVVHDLKTFVTLLELVQSNFPNISIIVPMTKADHPIQQAWLKQFEVTVSTYWMLYGLNVLVLHVRNDLHNQNDQRRSCSYLNVTDDTRMGVYSRSVVCTTSTRLDTCVPIVPPTKDVIVSTYFTSKEDPQRKATVSVNSFRYMVRWFTGIMRFNLNVIVFHDNLEDKWIKRIKAIYPRVNFIKADLNGRSTNDARYYIFWNYFVTHPEINRVFLTDLSDIQILGSPFHLMDIMGNHMIYIGIDEPFYLSSKESRWMNKVFAKCYGNGKSNVEGTQAMAMQSLYNAGIIGGTREMMLAMLYKVLHWLDKANKGENCNMISVNIAAHKHLFEELYAGYPLQNGYKAIATSNGLFLKHK